MPVGLTLPTKAITAPVTIKGKTVRRHALQFRCATAAGLTVQDVLPPSIHPDTGQPYQWVNTTAGLKEIPQALLKVWTDIVAQDDVLRPAGDVEASPAEIESALAFISPDIEYNEWLKIGMAIHHFDPNAFDVFDSWSARGEKYTGHDGINGTLTKWDSFNTGASNPVTVLSIYRQAHDNNWPGYRRPASETFEVVVETQPTPATPVAAGLNVAQMAPPVSPADAALAAADFDCVSWFSGLMPTEAEADQYAAPDWIIPNMVINGHIIVIVGWYNSGKTAIFMHLAKLMADKGYHVQYINADIGQGDAKYELKLAREGKFDLVLPSIKGVSMVQVLKGLHRLADSNKDLSKLVYIIDTMKKLVAVMGKNETRAAFDLFRRLQGLGATIILLGHANKFLDADGKLIPEGVGDVLNDPDDCLFFYHQKYADQHKQVITTAIEKSRGHFEQITYTLHFDVAQKTRSLELDDACDLTIIDNFRKKSQQEDRADANGEAVIAIKAAITAGIHKHNAIVDYGVSMRVTVNKMRTVLKNPIYNGVEWHDDGSQKISNNESHYLLGPKPVVRLVPVDVPSGDTDFSVIDEDKPTSLK